MIPLIKRDIRLAFKDGDNWLLGLLFFAIFLTICAIGLGGTFSRITPLAPSLFWLAIILSALLSVTTIFGSDVQDGSLTQIRLSGVSMFALCVAKAVTFICISILPLLLILPFAAYGFALNGPAITGLCLSVIIAAPAIAAYGVFAGALTLSRGSGHYLIILITVPLLVPIVIFAIAAADSFPEAGLWIPEFRALLGLSFIACAVGLPAASAALNVHFE